MSVVRTAEKLKLIIDEHDQALMTRNGHIIYDPVDKNIAEDIYNILLDATNAGYEYAKGEPLIIYKAILSFMKI